MKRQKKTYENREKDRDEESSYESFDSLLRTEFDELMASEEHSYHHQHHQPNIRIAPVNPGKGDVPQT